MQLDPSPLAEAQRQLLICSSCRYCEGYCATFPALERRTEYGAADVAYLANLCHDCRACYQACMYTPPHEFAVDIPQLLSSLRVQTYRAAAVPPSAAPLYGPRNGRFAGIVGLIALALLLAGLGAAGRWAALGTAHDGPGAFYAVVPFLWMLIPALALGLWALAVLTAGARRLVRDVAPQARASFADWMGALRDGVELVYLRGGGGGCYYPEPEQPSSARRVLHLVLVAGVALAFAATLAAAVEQDLLGRLPPYPLASVPVVLGTLGGVAILVGTLGLLSLKASHAARQLEPSAMVRLDTVFLMLLVVVAATGLLLLAVRTTPAMGPLLVIHLSAIAALFVTAPYGKFMHVPLRLAALLVFRLEEAADRR